IMFSMQFITPIQRQYANRNRNPGAVVGMVKYLAPLPPSLSVRVVAGAVRHDFVDVALGLSGLAGFVFLFSALLWQRYAAQYRGEELSESPAPSRAVPVRVVPRPSNPQIISAGRISRGLLRPILAPVARKGFFYLVRIGFEF